MENSVTQETILTALGRCAAVKCQARAGAPAFRRGCVTGLALLSAVAAMVLIGLRGSAMGAEVGPMVLFPFATEFLVAAQSREIKQPLRVAVQQAISALPPTAGQPISWGESDDPYAPGERKALLGAISFRTPEVLPMRNLTLRLAASYFSLSEEFGPVAYIGTPDRSGSVFSAASKSGVDVMVDALILNASATYGLLDGLDVAVNLPVAIVHADMKSLYSSPSDFFLKQSPGCVNKPCGVLFFNTLPSVAAAVIDGLEAGGFIPLGRADVNDVGGDLARNPQLGLGRVGLGFKANIIPSLWHPSVLADHMKLSVSEELSLPSPSADELAGTESFGALSRLILAVPLWNVGRAHIDGGYEFDSEFTELWRGVWNAGASFWVGPGLLDLGLSGSEYRNELNWSPARLKTDLVIGDQVSRLTWAAEQSTGVGGTSYIDFVAGGRLRLGDVVLSASVAVPVTEDGLRPTATVTGGLEYAFGNLW